MTHTLDAETVLSPVQAVARRVREVRNLRGWSAQELAERCAALGMASLDRSTIASIEIGRRKRIGVDELLLVLALALGVAPVHLLVPLTEEWYAVAPDHVTGAGKVRQWVRGNHPMTGVPLSGDPVERLADRETYLEQQPEQEWAPPPESTPAQRQARKREQIERLLEAEDAGLVRIERKQDGGWHITAAGTWVEQARGTGDDDGEH